VDHSVDHRMTRPKLFAAAPALLTGLAGLGLALVAGCAPQSETTIPMKAGAIATVEPAKPDATPTSKPLNVDKPAYSPHVVEIITKPTVIHPTTRTASTRPGTKNSGSTGGNVAVRPNPSPAAVAPPTPNGPAPKFTLDDLRRVDTAVTTAPLLRLVTMKLNHIPYQQFAGYGAVDFTPDLPEGKDPDAMQNDILSRDPAGTDVAIRRLIDGKVDLVIAPRQPTETENADAGKASAALRADYLATEALVFTVNTQNPVQGLSKEQLVGIFSGKYKTWKDLGPKTIAPNSEIADQPITVAYRARGTGSEELMSQILLNGQPMPELPVSKALSSNKLVLDAAAEDPETIGFSVFCYVTNMKPDARLRVLPIDGVMPEPANVASNTYPLTAPIYVISRTDLASTSDLFNLRAWLQNMGGQRVLAEAGYMPMLNEAWTSGRLK